MVREKRASRSAPDPPFTARGGGTSLYISVCVVLIAKQFVSMNQPKDEKLQPTIVIQPQDEPLASIVKLIAEYGFDQVEEAISVAEIYVH